jgi:prepilin-type N-terminal cleavage/methylation domain-containing protein
MIRQSEKGFTLLELTLTIVVVAILAVVATESMQNLNRNAREILTQNNLYQIRNADIAQNRAKIALNGISSVPSEPAFDPDGFPENLITYSKAIVDRGSASDLYCSDAGWIRVATSTDRTWYACTDQLIQVNSDTAGPGGDVEAVTGGPIYPGVPSKNPEAVVSAGALEAI